VWKIIINYNWLDQNLYFKDLMVLKPKQRKELVSEIHVHELDHFGKTRNLEEITCHFFCHNWTNIMSP
jgi:hypothetical protein